MKAVSQRGVFAWLARIVATLSVVVIGSLTWSYLFEPPYLSFGAMPFKTAPAAEAGQPILLLVERCNSGYRARSYLTTHTLRNVATGEEVMMPDVWIDVAPGCNVVTSRINIVPATTLPGTYTVWGVARVEGLAVTHAVPWTSLPFQVVPAKSVNIPGRTDRGI